MQLITVPKLRIAQLQSFTQSVLDITEGLSEISAQVTAVNTQFELFKAGMTRSDAESDKLTLDRTRDNLNSGFFKNVQAEQLYPYDADTLLLLSEIVKVTNEYGFGLSRLTYDEQTAQTDNMLSRLAALDMTPFPALSRWLPLIQTANDNFKAASEDYYQALTDSGETDAATIAAPPLTDALSNLFTILFSYVQIAATDELTRAYKELITLTETYK